VDILRRRKPSSQIIDLHHSGELHTYIPELDICYEVEQDSRYHKDDVFKHCIKTCDNTPNNMLFLRLAGLLHDIGKIPTRQVSQECMSCGEIYNHDDNLMNLDDENLYPYCIMCNSHDLEIRISFHKHELQSTKLANKVITRLGFGNGLKKDALKVIANHMYNYTTDWTSKAIHKFIHKTGITLDDLRETPSNFPLFILRRAERLSRGLSPVTKRQIDLETRIRQFLLHNR